MTLKDDKINVRGRLLRIESVKLTPASDGWPGLQASVGASSYIVPKTAEVAAQTTPGTIATTPSTTTAAAPSGANAG